MTSKDTQDIQQTQLKRFCVATIALFFIIAFCLASPREILEGMKTIIVSRDALITDYFKLASYGTAFFNSAIMMMFVFILLHILKVPFTGLTLAALFINGGFAMFGKNPVNVFPILLGVCFYAWQQGVSVKRYIYTGLFGTCLAPLVTEMAYILPFSPEVNLVGAFVVGILIGFILPGLATHTASMHMGYNLFNVGFASGILAFIIVCILKGFGLQSESVLIWSEGMPIWLICLLYGYFLLVFLYGLWINKGQVKPILKIFHHPGRAVADFVLMDGVGITLVNMALTGCFCLTYIILIGGDLSGPVVGSILTLFGFSAFGLHLKNYIPCMLGVFLATCFKIYTPTMPAMQLAVLFCAGLAPIAGQFGIFAGILAGLLHTSVVMCTGQLYSGLNLYNNGVSTGFVAIFMLPLLESFIKKFKKRDFGR
ncbi:MAG: DUF1576 domain-containing protein [Cellulosilyticum sp.]|nr:DUF1576 domain-containing protein [Cellulosilyticum sp.]